MTHRGFFFWAVSSSRHEETAGFSHTRMCGLKEWEIIPHSSVLSCTTELCQCVLGDPCAHKCSASFKIPQNRSDLLWRPCSSLCRNFPPRLNMHTQQLKNSSIPDVRGEKLELLDSAHEWTSWTQTAHYRLSQKSCMKDRLETWNSILIAEESPLAKVGNRDAQ